MYNTFKRLNIHTAPHFSTSITHQTELLKCILGESYIIFRFTSDHKNLKSFIFNITLYLQRFKGRLRAYDTKQNHWHYIYKSA